MSEAINTGGPAFPATEKHGCNSGWSGMDLRDYFIAHAPTEPQNWFHGQMPPPPRQRMAKPDDLTREEREELAAWGDVIDAKDMKQPRARVIAEDWERYQREHKAWQAEQKKQRYVQWPAAWADEMLKAREQTP
jgi:hypothetical protein